jgi:hypothetical protein
VPEGVHLLRLREEAVAAEVEAVAVADLGLCDPAHLVLGLEHDHGKAQLGQQVARGQAGGPAADDDRGLVPELGRCEILHGLGGERALLERIWRFEALVVVLAHAPVFV